jgi:hypothetical protein
LGYKRFILTRNSRDSEVTGCKLNVRGSTSGKGNDLSLFTTFRPAQQFTQPQNQWFRGACLPAVKEPERDTDRSSRKAEKPNSNVINEMGENLEYNVVSAFGTEKNHEILNYSR